MGLDIYVGTLTRYYSNTWENKFQQLGRKLGQAAIIRPDNPTNMPPDEVRPLVTHWQRLLNESLATTIGSDQRISWDESPDSPYFTDKSSWKCHGSLVVWAAYVDREYMRPDVLSKTWYKDEIVRNDEEFTAITRGVELWLPMNFSYVFSTMGLNGRDVTIASATQLLMQLSTLNTRTWNASPTEIAEWEKEEDGTLESMAKRAFSIIFGLTSKAIEFCLPMKLDH